MRCSLLSMAGFNSPSPKWRQVDIMGWQTHALGLLAFLLWRNFKDQPIPWAIGIYPLLLLFSRLEYFLKARADPREPPLIPHPYLPFVGHLIGMFRYGAKYYDIVNKEAKYPIYTLLTLTSRTVIVASPQIAAVVQRANKSLSFYGAILSVTERMVGFDKTAMSVIWENVDRDSGDHGLMNESHDMVSSMLGPGPTLNSMSAIQLDAIADAMNSYIPTPRARPDTLDCGKPAKLTRLMDFTKHVFTTSNAYAFYGPENPFVLNPGLDKVWWTFEDSIKQFIADIVPSLTAPTANTARNKMVAALEDYARHERYNTASPLIRQRFALNFRNGLSIASTARSELILLFAIMGNAVPTTFWLLANIFSRPKLLQTLREQCGAAVTITNGEQGEVRTLSISKLKECAPLLVSCFRETLRGIIALTSVRYVREDVSILEYRLRKGSVVQMASGVIHSDTSIWGPDAAEFKPDRFLGRDESGATYALPLPPSVPSAAFRAFGGGSVICPGRHFALSEIIGFTALVLLGWEIESENGGLIQCPLKDDMKIPFTPMKPVRDVDMKITRRDGYEGCEWRLEL
ncbi:cytochrome P450 [Mytilinidion resinicola]|uniref:Cytochrome P450 n=1 Tax=Mytilinidion resinicola TaxID=574789 RepID=A0A6A6Z3R3_9PEZI|nr:cytochrome P450 [Mytilinidion resinicola]KAF2815660.1 cytochrome P450 [Mytilinidion resinicola]